MSVSSDPELFAGSCQICANYPKNVIRDTTPRHHLDRYGERLDEHEHRIFCEDGRASVDIWEYDDNVQEFCPTRASSIFELNGRLQGANLYDHDDPRCRFVFIYAPHSRERLRISRKMLACVLTHHQAMPVFLDFVFPFGLQEYQQDFHFSGFREDTQLLLSDRGLKIPKLGRSGREIRLCYILKSVEASKGNPGWPWSIRQSSIYHSFDVETGKSFWVIIKGNKLLRNRIRTATGKDVGQSSLGSFSSAAEAFSSSLAVHLILCDWCDEEWRWYLNYLEKKLQDATRRSLAITIHKEPSFMDQPSRKSTAEMPPSRLRTISASFKRTFSMAMPNNPQKPALELQKIPYQPSFPQPHHEQTITVPPPPPVIPPGMPGALPTTHADDQEDFTFRDLQQVQYIEENANEIFLVLESNVDVLNELKQHYNFILNSEDCPDQLKNDCRTAVARFEKRIASIIIDLQRQRARTQVLQRFLSDRKNLLYGILNHRAIEASKTLAKKSQMSAENMEKMTESMQNIAQKTKEETASMRIITLVTLFFLPGTFISASQDQTGRIFQLGALQLYLEITVPLMFFTFAAWYAVYQWLNRREDNKAGGVYFPPSTFMA